MRVVKTINRTYLECTNIACKLQASIEKVSRAYEEHVVSELHHMDSVLVYTHDPVTNRVEVSLVTKEKKIVIGLEEGFWR